MFITFEGLDCSGKSTQIRLLSDRLSLKDFRVLVLREPGGTDIGEKIRKILLDKNNLGMTEASELLLFSACRAQLVSEVIKPASDNGMIVLCDRFYDSTTAYQGYGRCINLDMIHKINQFASNNLIPDLTLFLDIPITEIEKRVRQAKKNKDRMETVGAEFFEKVRNGYLEIAKQESRFKIINGLQSIDDLHEEIYSVVSNLLIK